MGNKSPVIELNGKQYDTQSGHPVANSSKHKAITKPVSGVHLDGFTARPKKPSEVHHKRVAAHQTHQKQERSHTLMRHSVKKPQLVTQKAAPATIAVPAAQIIHTREDIKRLKRAEEIKKSSKITRFSSSPAIIQKLAHVLPVQQAPVHHHETAPVSPPKRHAEIQNPFYDALKHATSHTQPRLKKASLRRRTANKLHVTPGVLNIGAGVFAVLLLTGFFAYQNVPNLSMRVAAARAGVNASLPGYHPSGFSLRGPIHAQAGKVSFAYKSNSDSREFNVDQQASEWNNESLVQKYVAVDNRPYQTYQDGDKTIYIYDANNATWLDHGIWYKIEGNSSLNTDQLLRLANSL